MEWTKTSPTEAGHYWYWEAGRGVRLQTIEAHRASDGPYTYYSLDAKSLKAIYHRPAEKPGWWMGPIPKPNKPTPKQQREAQP